MEIWISTPLGEEFELDGIPSSHGLQDGRTDGRLQGDGLVYSTLTLRTSIA